ncbi:MAG: CDP-alcohol phosphatidyltransferase family protein [Paraprevotella sp.]|nr:CDP-alcohol phosphatidyltransferase family protein [Paraprevotella sp.]
MTSSTLKERVQATMKSEDTEGAFELYVTRTPGYLWALLFKKLHVHPITVTLLSIVIGAAAGYFFYWNSLYMNFIGMLLLIWANWYDCADGQLARMTGQKTLIGRILDGFAGDVWFFSIYFFLCLRMTPETAPWGRPWKTWIWIIAAYSGFYCHSKQCALADYYRNIHLYFLKGKDGSELDNCAQQRTLMRALPWNGKEWFHKIYLYFYGNYTQGQVKMTPKFQKFYRLVQARYKGEFPQTLRDRFRTASLPLMKYTNILTFDTRVIVLFISLAIGKPWLFFCFEIIVLEALRLYTCHVHEKFCDRFTKELENE